MALRSAQFYVEQFKIEQRENGFRSARSKLIEAMRVEIDYAALIEGAKSMDEMAEILKRLKKKWNAICHKLPEMDQSRRAFDMLVKKTDEVAYNHWKYKSMSEN